MAVDTLEQRCINVLSRNFIERPITHSQLNKPELLDQIEARLDPDLDPFALARHVVSEQFWRRRLEQQQQQTPTDLIAHTCSSAKGAVLQSALQQVIEADDTERLAAIDLDVVVEHIFALRLTKIPLCIDLSTTLASLKNLTSLQIELGHAGISDDEAMALGKALPSIECLTSLSLTNCCLSDDCIQAMKDGMKSNTGPSSSSCLPPGLIALDVSDNKLTAGGLGILFDMMASSVKDGNKLNCVLSSFVAANNCIDEEGGRFLATDVLPAFTSLTFLNVKLNQLGDVGGEMIFRALQHQEHSDTVSNEKSQLQHICLAGNGLSSKTATALSELLGEDCIGALSFFDLSLNNLSSEDIVNVISAIEEKAHQNGTSRATCSLLQLDLRENPGHDGDGAGRIYDIVARIERDCSDVRVHV